MKIDSVHLDGQNLPISFWQFFGESGNVPKNDTNLLRPIHHSFWSVTLRQSADTVILSCNNTSGVKGSGGGVVAPFPSIIKMLIDTQHNILRVFDIVGNDAYSSISLTTTNVGYTYLGNTFIAFINGNSTASSFNNYETMWSNLIDNSNNNLNQEIDRYYSRQCCYTDSSWLKITMYGQMPYNSVSEAPEKGQIRISPNPVSNLLHVHDIADSKSITLVNMLGESLRTINVYAGQTDIDIDVHDLPSGVYLLRVGDQTRNIVIEQR
jgi:hypothetical protein